MNPKQKNIYTKKSYIAYHNQGVETSDKEKLKAVREQKTYYMRGNKRGCQAFVIRKCNPKSAE